MTDRSRDQAAVALLVVDWLKSLSKRLERADDFGDAGALDVRRLADDVGLSGDEFIRLARLPTAIDDLLAMRLSVLGLTQEAIAEAGPQSVDELRRTCLQCGTRDICTRDLAGRPDSGVWKAYCPNVNKIIALVG